MSITLAVLAGRPAALIAAIGLVLCLVLLWSGVGNILSVVLPIRDASIRQHRNEGTFKQFAIEFSVTWFISYVVQFMMIWRIFAAQGVGQRYGSTWIVVISLVGEAAITWSMLSVVAVSLANQPAIARRLRRELDWDLIDAPGSSSDT